MTKPAAAERRMLLGMFLNETGDHIAAWRQPAATVLGESHFLRQLDIARLAERALFDFALIADVGVRNTDPPDMLSRQSAFDRLDPIMMLASLAATTTQLGLIGTASTTFSEPWDIARKMASLDHISGGRAGWNIVTSINDTLALNYSRTQLDAPADRYAQAEEFVDVVRGLWDSWDADALLIDKAGGRYFDPNRMHILNHRGQHFSVHGPLDVMRPPQGHPILVQAGSSPEGRALGARVADVIFSTHQTLDAARAFCQDIRGRATAFGRDPDAIRIVMALIPMVGATLAEAEAKFAALQESIHPSLALPGLARQLGNVDVSPYPLDAPLPRDLPPPTGLTSRRKPLLDLAERNRWTLQDLARWVAGTRGHRTAIGTPAMIADQMEEWFVAGAADGYLMVFPELPASLDEFRQHVVPELQRRGLTRPAYGAGMLRERLGLAGR